MKLSSITSTAQKVKAKEAIIMPTVVAVDKAPVGHLIAFSALAANAHVPFADEALVVSVQTPQ